MLKVLYFVDSKTGASPVKNYIEKIPKDSVKAKIKISIDYVAEKDGMAGNFLTKNIRGYNISEIRVKISKNLYRIMYCIWKNNYLIILHIFYKKEGQSTPEKELKIAQENYEDFIKNPGIYF